jgi:hypothetical protein
MRKRKEQENKNVIEVKEEVKIGDYVLEAGDKIEVLNEAYGDDLDYSILDRMNAAKGDIVRKSKDLLGMYGDDWEEVYWSVINRLTNTDEIEQVLTTILASEADKRRGRR